MTKRRIRVKIQFDRNWRPTHAQSKRYWVNLTNGGFFPIFVSGAGRWHNLYAQHASLPTMDAAITDGLERHLDNDNRDRYRKIRCKVRVFTIRDTAVKV